MQTLRYTLVSEGSSDEALKPLLDWLLRSNQIRLAIQGEWADLGESRLAGKRTLATKISEAVRLYPCDLLFVHRDADRESREKRLAEIDAALRETDCSIPAVCVIPVRMQEAWFLFDEQAIRQAAGNRNGRFSLNLPQITQVESIPNPKQILHECLKQASGLTGRRLKNFRVTENARRVGAFIEDFSPLRVLPAFTAFEEDLRHIIANNSWNQSEA